MRHGPVGYYVKEENISSFSVPPSGKALLRILLPEAELSKSHWKFSRYLALPLASMLHNYFLLTKKAAYWGTGQIICIFWLPFPCSFTFHYIHFTLLVLYPNFILLALCFNTYFQLTFLYFLCSSHLLLPQTMPSVQVLRDHRKMGNRKVFEGLNYPPFPWKQN